MGFVYRGCPGHAGALVLQPGYYKKDFNGGVKKFEAARHPHPESFMVGMGYYPDVDNAKRMGRPYDILHEHTRFYQTSYSRLEIDRTERETEHGNPTAALTERYHYHHGLRAGENTLGAHLTRTLIRSVIDASRYEPQSFIEAFIHHLSTPGLNQDPYTEIYIRRWFEHYSRGIPPYACAELQRHSWSIGSHGGVIRPLVVGLLAASAYQGLGLAIEHQNLTHRSENNAAALGILVPMLHDLLQGRDGIEAAMSYSRQVRLPRVSGYA
jgi:hypothetical protein